MCSEKAKTEATSLFRVMSATLLMVMFTISHVPTMCQAWHILSPVVVRALRVGRCSSLRFSDEDAEAWRGGMLAQGPTAEHGRAGI